MSFLGLLYLVYFLFHCFCLKKKKKNTLDTLSATKFQVTRMYQLFPTTLQSPTFLVPGTSFMEDNFSTDRVEEDGFRMIQAHYIYCALYFYYYYIVI